MANPIDALKKFKSISWTELRARGGQAIAGYGEQLGFGGGNSLSDEDFLKLLDKSAFEGENIRAETLFEKFCQNSAVAFFASFRDKERMLEIFRREFGDASAKFYIEKADRLVEGKFDLLGYANLDFGAAVDWHFEPTSNTHSPFKHWKQFDELSSDETGDKKIIWELNRHQHFFTLGVAFWLTGDERYAATFVRHLDSWIEQNPPSTGVNWCSSLEVAFRATSWIWAFQFFKDATSFTPELFRKALKSLHFHARHIEKYLSTYYSPNTHLTGEALGLYYLGTQLPFFERAAHWRKTGAEILLAELDRQILPDGVYFEQSTWYQRYTTDFYAQFLILERLNRSETDENLPAKVGEKLQKSFDFLMAITRPDGTTPLIGDDDGGRCLPHSNAAASDFRAALSTGALLFRRGDYKFVADYFAEETLWLLGAEAFQAFADLPAETPAENSFSFKDGGYFVMRDGWTETDNFMLVDCGELGALNAGHAHADALSFELAVGGKTMLIDAGTYTYHESEAARNRFRATDAHNTLTIGGASQSEPGGKFNWQTKANARLENWISQDRFDFFEGAHDGFERFTEAPATHSRSVLFLKNDYWIMRDFVETTGAHDYALSFQFAPETKVSVETAENGVPCVGASSEEIGLRLFTFGDNGDWKSETGEISPVFGKKIDAPRLRFASKGAGAQEFFTFLLPQENGFAAPQVYETEIFGGGRAFVINYRDYTDVFVFSDGAQIVRTEIFNTNFRFLWARLNSVEETPEEFVLIGGTHFSVGGREIFNQPNALEFATARRFGKQLNVRTPDSVFSVSLPQKKPTTYVLKDSE